MKMVYFQVLFKIILTVWIIGETALHRAAEYGHLEVVRVLVNAGADINIKNNFGIFSSFVQNYI